ncbi:Hypothetical predicted protein [Paramuricea clavata]|uniref:Apple domain-containing protein n=1 Tax=Paramuricea clavata TaxID=317549 RepID=A0A6S7JVL4_PARCT|nr:Hypothetical predicted protein [Paramuricea clavata]
MEAVYRKHKEKYLANYIFRTIKTKWEHECATHCFRDNLCASVNYKISGIGKGLCELSKKTLDEASNEGTRSLEFNHLDIIKRVCPEPEQVFSSNTTYRSHMHGACSHGGSCPGCPNATNKILIEHICIETKRCDRAPLILSSSCKKLLEQKAQFQLTEFSSFVVSINKFRSLPNGVHTMQLNISSSPYKVYCHMTDIPGCGGGGWTLVMKVNGSMNTFTYDSVLWKNKETYAIQNGLEGISDKESKLASYWNTPFTKICLGMSHNGERKWMTLNYAASSLYSVIADGQFRATTAGKATWKSLIAGTSLQNNCNREGFNVKFNSNSAMRIGIVANNEGDCNTCDSWLGFSRAYVYDGTSNNILVCGNKATCCSSENEIKTLVTFGYILVQ